MWHLVQNIISNIQILGRQLVHNDINSTKKIAHFYIRQNFFTPNRNNLGDLWRIQTVQLNFNTIMSNVIIT